MEIRTSRFGTIAIECRDVLEFPQGMAGLEECTHWVLLGDEHNEALGWLQSTQHPEVALAVVCPRRFVADYQLRVCRSELGAELFERVNEAQVLVIASKQADGITLNLKAPLVIDLARRLGRQVIANGEQPLRYQLDEVSGRENRSSELVLSKCA